MHEVKQSQGIIEIYLLLKVLEVWDYGLKYGSMEVWTMYSEWKYGSMEVWKYGTMV